MIKIAPPPQELDVVTYEKAAERLGGDKAVSVRHVERLVAAGKLRSIGSGQARRIVTRSIIAYIEGGQS